jgi:hypothetical protein
LKDSNNQLLKDTLTDSTALIGTCGFVIVLGVMFYFIFSFF